MNKSTYKIYNTNQGKNITKFLCDKYPDFFSLTNEKKNADVSIKTWDPTIQKNLYAESKTIYVINFNKKKFPRTTRRISDMVDQHHVQDATFNGISFCMGLDMMGEHIISKPLPHMPYEAISKNKDYFKEISNEEFKFHNKCFWRGGYTHIIRQKIINFINNKKDLRFDLKFWRPKTGEIYIPGKKRPEAWEYDEYFNNLSNSDIGLCIRGDRPWLFSFFDIIRAGAIPVCINTQYHNLGWEKIGIDWKDLFLSYNLTENDTLQDVYKGIDNLLKNKIKCLEMKKNLRYFYKNIYLTDRTHNFDNILKGVLGFGDFFAAKIIEIIENNFNLKDNKFFCETVFKIKKI